MSRRPPGTEGPSLALRVIVSTILFWVAVLLSWTSFWVTGSDLVAVIIFVAALVLGLLFFRGSLMEIFHPSGTRRRPPPRRRR